MKSYSRESFLEAKELWETGDFGWRWQKYRRIAAEAGYIYPPTGTKHDDRQSPEPSQRAIVWHALETRPEETERIIRRSRSWSQVVDGIFGMEARVAAEVGEEERDVAWDRENDPDHRESVMALSNIIKRIGDSA